MEKKIKKKDRKNKSLKDQNKIEETIKKIFSLEGFDIKNPDKFNIDILFDVDGCFDFARNKIYSIPSGYAGIDSGAPWFAFWVLNIFYICNQQKYELSKNDKLKFVKYLKYLQHEEGGFKGFSFGIPHIISNYAAIMAIIILGIEEAYDIIDRDKMKTFLLNMKYNKQNKNNDVKDINNLFLIKRNDENNCHQFTSNWPGSFQCHHNGESDLRATYCALTVAYILNILDDELLEDVCEYVKKCQTFEGGLGPEPYCEAHGGYSFCGVASLTLLNQLETIDVKRFILWAINKQMKDEGGFQGRTNKLVDSCYSFWQASVFNIILMNDSKNLYSQDNELLYDQLALQAYILLCCQYPSGGLIDKPGKKPDLFHTMYASTGLALSQQSLISEEFKVVLSYSDTLEFSKINPIFGIDEKLVNKARDYFLNK